MGCFFVPWRFVSASGLANALPVAGEVRLADRERGLLSRETRCPKSRCAWVPFPFGRVERWWKPLPQVPSTLILRHPERKRKEKSSKEDVKIRQTSQHVNITFH